MWAVHPNSHFNLHFISFTTSMWFEHVTKVPLTWKQPLENSWRKLRTKRRRNSAKTNRSHLNDPISRLDSSPHRRSICDRTQRWRDGNARERSNVCVSFTYFLWPAAQRQDCLHSQSAQSHFYLSGLSHSAGQDLNTHKPTPGRSQTGPFTLTSYFWKNA